MARPRRRERERERHRNEILDAAERVFERKPFHQATMAEVAEEAEFAVGSLYNFFPGKNELYAAMVERVVAKYMPVMREKIRSAPSPIDALTAVFDLKLEVLEQHKGFVRAFFGQPHVGRRDSASGPQDALKEAYAAYVGDLESVFRSGVKDGSFASADPQDLAIAFEGLTDAFVGRWVEEEGPVPDAEQARKVLQIFLHGATA